MGLRGASQWILRIVMLSLRRLLPRVVSVACVIICFAPFASAQQADSGASQAPPAGSQTTQTQDGTFTLGEIVYVLGKDPGRSRRGRVGRHARAAADVRAEQPGPGRQPGAGRRQQLRRERPPQRVGHLRAGLRAAAGAADGRRRPHLPAGRQPPRLRPVPHGGRRRHPDPEGLRVRARRSWCDGRRHQPGDDEADESLRSRRRDLGRRPRRRRAGTPTPSSARGSRGTTCRAAWPCRIATRGRCRATISRRPPRCSEAASA